MSKGFLGNWGNEGSDRSCNDGSDLYRPITKKPTKTSLSPSQEEEHTSGRDQTKDGAAEKATMTINKRDSAEDHGGRQSQQVWKRDPLEEERYNSTYQGGWRPKEGAMYRKDSSTGLWMIPESDPFKVPSVTEEDFEKGPRAGPPGQERKQEWSNFYSSDDYVKDELTNLMMAPITEGVCKAYDGFVCKVGLGVASYKHDGNGWLNHN